MKIKVRKILRIAAVVWIVLAVIAFVVSEAVDFVASGDGVTRDGGFAVSLHELDELIAEAEAARDSGADCSEWQCRLKPKMSHVVSGSDWNAVIGELYALKSTCIVRYSPTVVMSKAMFSIALDDAYHYILGGVLCIPVDIVHLPIQVAFQIKNHVQVSDENLSQALHYLSKARDLGFEMDYFSTGGPGFPAPSHLDRVGYDLDAARK